MDSKTEATKAPTPPDFLFHCTDRVKRASILTEGLLARMSDAFQAAKSLGVKDEDNLGSGIYFDSVSDYPGASIDVWKVDVRGLDIELDDQSQFDGDDPEWVGHVWWVLYNADVEPGRLTLLG